MIKRIKILSSTIALASVGISGATSISLISSNSLNKSAIVNSNNTKNDSVSDLVPAQANGQNANLSTNAGPVTFNGNVITALDWYGNKLWSINMGDKVPEPTTYNSSNPLKTGYTGAWRRAWYNWDYNRQSDILWVLGYPNGAQKLFGIKASNGNIEKTITLDNSGYRFITALSSGKVLVYGGAGTNYDATGILVDPSTSTFEKLSGNSNKHLPSSDGDSSHNGKYRWYFYNLIPLTANKNLVEVVAFDRNSGTSGDESAKNATYNVYGILVDDKLDFIGGSQASGSQLSSAFLLATGMQGYRNTKITPQRDYFTLLNSQTVSITYNTVTLFDSSDQNNIKVKKVKMASGNTNWIQTWTVDSNDNLYFKFKNAGQIYKIDGDTLKSGSESFSPKTYYDLESASTPIKEEAKNFLIFNVYGYTGQLMLVDASYNDAIDIYKSKLDNNTESTNWGLAAAVVPNKGDNAAGDLKGILNGPKSIQKVADFSISQSVLDSKIPSEITKQDIQLENDAFFKNDDPKPFVISNINDTNGTFVVTANLYKIPWFADKLPTNSVPKVVSYTFDGSGGNNKPKAQSITKKVSWKKLDSSSNYDFMNMKPSNVKQEDLDALDPFQASFQSQMIFDSKTGKQLYPKTTYSIGTKDDSNGTIQIKVKYEYIPMSVTYRNGQSDTSYDFGDKKIPEQQIQTYETNQEYKIFKSGDTSAFYFMGSNNQSSDNNEIDIDARQVPQLKNLLSAGKLPTSFANLNNNNDSKNSEFLQFVNTSNSKGYPISKMNFQVNPNDSDGSLSISATMPQQYSPDGKPHIYKVKYTNLNKTTEYKFNFQNPNKIGGVSLSSILPSAIDEGDIIKNFITYSGFNSNDFNVILNPNDEQGSLAVQVNLNNGYASSIATANGFNNYSIVKTFTGFMTTSQYNSRYSLTFKGDDDTNLLTLKSMQANEIITAFGSDGVSGKKSLVVGNQTYTSLNEFVEKLLIKDKGTSIPSGWNKSDSGVSTNVYVDNNLGIASFYVNIKKEKVEGATSDLNFVVTYSGFVKGNVDSTKDNLSFVSNAMLKNYLKSNCGFDDKKINSLTPKSFADWVNQENNIQKLITYKTGQYENKLKDKSYTLTVTSNDLQGTVSITINFGKMDNPKSLSEYSIQYTI